MNSEQSSMLSPSRVNNDAIAIQEKIAFEMAIGILDKWKTERACYEWYKNIEGCCLIEFSDSRKLIVEKALAMLFQAGWKPEIISEHTPVKTVQDYQVLLTAPKSVLS